MPKVIMSCDDNPYYLDFWPLVSWVWKEKMGIEPVLIHIGENNPTRKHIKLDTKQVKATTFN